MGRVDPHEVVVGQLPQSMRAGAKVIEDRIKAALPDTAPIDQGFCITIGLAVWLKRLESMGRLDDMEARHIEFVYEAGRLSATQMVGRQHLLDTVEEVMKAIDLNTLGGDAD